MLRRAHRYVRIVLVRLSFSFRPRVTVLTLTGVSTGRDGPRSTRRVQYLNQPRAAGAKGARGALIVLLDEAEWGVEVSSALVERLAAAPYRDAALVPTAPDAAAPPRADRAAVAATTPGAAFRRADVRKVLAGSAGTTPTAAAVRVHVAAAMTSPVVTWPCPLPQRPADKRDASHASEAAEALAEAAKTAPGGAERDGFRGDVARIAGHRLGLAVRSRPAERAAVVEAIVHGGSSLPLDAVNSGAATKLAVAYAFPPFLDASGFIAARRLELEGEPYDILTKDVGSERPVDPRSAELGATLQGRRMTVAGRTGFGSGKAVAHFCAEGLKLVDRRVAELGDYESMYTRVMWPAPAAFGAIYKVRHPDIRWTAEISDPLRVRTDGTLRDYELPATALIGEVLEALGADRVAAFGKKFGVFEFLELAMYALADEIIFTNENQRDLMLDSFPDRAAAQRAREVSRVAHHPTPPSRFYELAEPASGIPTDRVTVGYFGRFYGVRGVDYLIAPLAALTLSERSQVALLIFTTDHDEAIAAVTARGLEDVVEVRDALGYFEFLRTAGAMDWLVVADAHCAGVFDANPYLPSKLADYQGAGARIWAMSEPGSILDAADVDARSALGDLDAAVDVLRTRILGDATRRGGELR